MRQLKSHLLFVCLLLGCVVAGIASASALTETDDLASVVNEQPVPGTASVETTARDPYGDAPWAVTVYRSASGHRCAAPTQLRDGRTGFETPSGFRPVAAEQAASCGSDEALSTQTPVDLHLGMTRTPSGPVIRVWGIALPVVEEISIETPVGSTRVKPSARGAFIAVWKGDDRALEGRLTRLTSSLATGKTAVQEATPPVLPSDAEMRARAEAYSPDRSHNHD